MERTMTTRRQSIRSSRHIPPPVHVPVLVIISLTFLLFLKTHIRSPPRSRTIPPRPAIPIPVNEKLGRPLHLHGQSRIPRPPKIPGMRPRSILIYVPRGGIGNQIYFLAEALFLARRAHLDLHVPAFIGRKLASGVSTDILEPSEKFWDLSRLEAGLNGGRVHTDLSECGGRIKVVYVVSRTERPEESIGAAVRGVVCGGIGVCERMFEKSAVLTRWLPLSGIDMRFVDEVSRWRASDDGDGNAVCVVVDGHSYNRGGLVGHEYLHSFMHFMEGSVRVYDIARTFPQNMSVVHVRFDEKECVVTEERKGMVCVRNVQAAGREDTAYWVSISEIVEAVMSGCGTRRLYLAVSPYVPDEVVKGLREGFKDRVVVEEAVDERVGDNMKNFVERQLAIDAECFVGDFGSTWSGTVYYKRRSMGRRSLWSNVLLGRGKDLGFYDVTERLDEPEIFEEREREGGIGWRMGG